jgi:hypothetical protein
MRGDDHGSAFRAIEPHKKFGAIRAVKCDNIGGDGFPSGIMVGLGIRSLAKQQECLDQPTPEQ